MFHGHVQDVPVPVFERDILLRPVRGLYLPGADDLADAVRLVYGVIPHFGGGEHIPPLAADAPGFARLGVQVPRADDRELAFVQDKALVRRLGQDAHPAEVGEAVGQADGGDVLVAEHLLHLRRPRGVPAVHEYPISPFQPVLHVGEQGGKAVEIAGDGRGGQVEDLQRLEEEIPARKRLQGDAAERTYFSEKVLLVRILSRGEGKRLSPFPQAVIPLFVLLIERVESVPERLSFVEHQHGVPGQNGEKIDGISQ